eukprot:scaffold48_cov395-Prasinococcus_capsulatus_cf.AAC.47
MVACIAVQRQQQGSRASALRQRAEASAARGARVPCLLRVWAYVKQGRTCKAMMASMAIKNRR